MTQKVNRLQGGGSNH